MFDLDAWNEGIQKPYHGGLRPDGTQSTQPAPDNEIDGLATAPFVATTNGEATNADIGPHSRPIGDQSKEVEPNVIRQPYQQPTEQPPEDDADIETGVGGMSVREQSAVEDMLRERHLSTS